MRGTCLKCKPGFYRATTASLYDTCLSSCLVATSSQTNGLGTCDYFSSGIPNCLTKTPAGNECTRCIKYFYPSQNTVKTSAAEKPLLYSCLTGEYLIPIRNSFISYKFPSLTPSGDGTELVLSAKTINNVPCFYTYVSCYDTTSSGQYLSDTNNDDLKDTSVADCTGSGLFPGIFSCLRVSDLVQNCFSYSEQTLCTFCETGFKLVSPHSNNLNSVCIECDDTCPCKGSCGNCIA